MISSFTSRDHLDSLREQAITRIIRSRYELMAGQEVLKRIEESLVRDHLRNKCNSDFKKDVTYNYGYGPVVGVVEEVRTGWYESTESWIVFRPYTKKGKLSKYTDTIDFSRLEHFSPPPEPTSRSSSDKAGRE